MTRPTLLRAAEALARDLQAADVASPRRQAHVIARAAALMPELVAALRVTERAATERKPDLGALSRLEELAAQDADDL